MNAYELADSLNWIYTHVHRDERFTDSSNMLRQQADRIAELENKTEYYWDGQSDNAVIIRAIPKPLSDEEIKEIAIKVGFLTEEDLTPEWSEYTKEFVDCVRAIEAKVRGEK